ncbi:MAG: hypothetical protein Q8Q49_05510 [bacterium]|nr:hypothetical protein [bacterium]
MEDKQTGNIDSSHDSNVPPKKTRRIHIFVGVLVCMILLLVAATYAISRTFQLPGEKVMKGLSVPSPTETATSSRFAEVSQWKQPIWYLARDTQGNLVLGRLEGNNEATIAQNKGKILGDPSFQAISKSGKYLVYIQLPDEVIADFQKNPPYEYYGSSDYDLHLVTISREEISDKIIDTKVASLLEPGVFAFDKDEKGVFYPKYENKDVTYYYDFQSGIGVATELPGYLKPTVITSPSYRTYASLAVHPRNPSDTKINNVYDLNFYSIDGKNEAPLYKSFISGEQSLLFPTEDSLFLAREDYVDGPDSVCYIEMVTVKTKQVTQLAKKDCPPGFNETNFHDLSLSPDGTFLVAEYSEQGPTNQNGTANFFMYNVLTKQTKTLGDIIGLYGTYFWISPKEFLANVGRESGKVVKINIETGQISDAEEFKDRTILAVF